MRSFIDFDTRDRWEWLVVIFGLWYSTAEIFDLDETGTFWNHIFVLGFTAAWGLILRWLLETYLPFAIILACFIAVAWEFLEWPVQGWFDYGDVIAYISSTLFLLLMKRHLRS